MRRGSEMKLPKQGDHDASRGLEWGRLIQGNVNGKAWMGLE
jgi:hypothetical protein